MATAPLNPVPEITIVKPTFKAYGEFFLIALIIFFYDKIIFIMILLGIWYHKASRQYVITDTHLIVDKGLVIKNIKKVPLNRIKEIFVKQGPLQKPFEVGALRIIHTEPNLKPLDIKGIAYPAQVKGLIVKRIRALRAQAEAAAAGDTGEQASNS